MNHDEIISKAWERYYSPETEEIADYTKYDALFDITRNMNISDEELEKIMNDMEYL